MELLFGGVPGRPRGDGLDGHAWWPLFQATPIEYMENYYPILIEKYRPVKDSGGAGLHRGGCGIEKVYHMLAAGGSPSTTTARSCRPGASMAACLAAHLANG